MYQINIPLDLDLYKIEWFQGLSMLTLVGF